MLSSDDMYLFLVLIFILTGLESQTNDTAGRRETCLKNENNLDIGYQTFDAVCMEGFDDNACSFGR